MMNDSTAHALLLEHTSRGADLDIAVETSTYWNGAVTADDTTVIEVVRDGQSTTAVVVWSATGRSQTRLDESGVRALIDLLRAAVD